MKEQLIELWCKATKERELEEYTEDTRNLYDYTMKMVECIKDTKESSDAIIIEQKTEIERLNNIINNTAVELEILLQSENFELITMQLRNIVFRLKGSDKDVTT